MRKYFITGLVLLLPITLTVLIVSFLFGLLTDPFIGIVKSILDYYDLFSNGFLFLSADQLQKYFSQLIILILLFFFTVGLGFLARWFFFHYLLRMWDNLLNHIPFISGVYKTCQDIIKTIFSSSSNSFKEVVLIPFPSENILAIGLVTKKNLPAIKKDGSPLVSVFIPTTPNPTSGFLVMCRIEDLIFLDMSVEEALKYIISCGVLSTPLTPKSDTPKQENLIIDEPLFDED